MRCAATKTTACPGAGIGPPCHPSSNFNLRNVREHRGTFGAFIACAVQRGNAIVIAPARQYGDITKRRARQYFRADAFAGPVFRITPVNGIPRQVPLGPNRPRTFYVSGSLLGCRDDGDFNARGRGWRKDVKRRDYVRGGGGG